jgi:hypothetical protein
VGWGEGTRCGEVRGVELRLAGHTADECTILYRYADLDPE